MKEIKDDKPEEWEETEELEEDFVESDNIMQFSDFVEPQEQRKQTQRITELRRRAEERQDWKRITEEYDLDLDDAFEEA